jgi:2-oxoglutarate dehydrogenase E2 component (dihydrolipoamide succinyltransferase)
MPTNIVVPELGESVIEATISRWLKQPGERVTAGEPLVELETEKVNLEVGAERAGVLGRINHQAGADVHVGDVLGVIDEAAEGQAAPAATSPAPEPTATAQPTAIMPDPKAQAQNRASEPAPEPAANAAPEAAAAEAPLAQPAPASAEVTPVARRMAEQEGVDLAQLAAQAQGRRVTKQDVQEFLGRQQPGAPAGAAPATRPPASAADKPAPSTPATSPAANGHRREERVRMSRRRRTIARRLVEAQHTAAMLTTFNEVDMGAVMEIRKRRKEAFKEKHGVGLGFMSFFVKAVIGALKGFPTLNAEIQEDEIVLKHYYDIGMAIGADEGLVVPVLRDADNLSFAGIERAIEGFVQKAKTGTLELEDLRGGTFTITNGGVFGSLLSTPILNPPQVGILGLHKIEERPIARQGEVVIRPLMYVALSYDHRLVDGREAVQFLVRVKELLEDPETLLLEG